jgi:hypothetical protein
MLAVLSGAPAAGAVLTWACASVLRPGLAVGVAGGALLLLLLLGRAAAIGPVGRAVAAATLVGGRGAVAATAAALIGGRAAVAATASPVLGLRSTVLLLLWGRTGSRGGGSTAGVSGGAASVHLVVELRVANLLGIRLHHSHVEHNHHPAGGQAGRAGEER